MAIKKCAQCPKCGMPVKPERVHDASDYDMKRKMERAALAVLHAQKLLTAMQKILRVKRADEFGSWYTETLEKIGLRNTGPVGLNNYSKWAVSLAFQMKVFVATIEGKRREKQQYGEIENEITKYIATITMFLGRITNAIQGYVENLNDSITAITYFEDNLSEDDQKSWKVLNYIESADSGKYIETQMAFAEYKVGKIDAYQSLLQSYTNSLDLLKAVTTDIETLVENHQHEKEQHQEGAGAKKFRSRSCQRTSTSSYVP